MSASTLPATRKITAAFRKYFTCQRCGACCTVFDGVKVSKGEIKRLTPPQTVWRDTFMLFARSTYMKQPCRFYDGAKNGCSVYNIRPRTCREFPVCIMESPNHKKLMVVSENCPAALKAMAQTEVECRAR